MKPETLLFCLTHPPTQSHNKAPGILPPSHKVSPSLCLLAPVVWWGHCEDDSPRAGLFLEGVDLSHAPANWGVCKVPQGTSCAWSVPGQAGRGSVLCGVPGKALAVSTGLGFRAFKGGAEGGTLGCSSASPGPHTLGPI